MHADRQTRIESMRLATRYAPLCAAIQDATGRERDVAIWTVLTDAVKDEAIGDLMPRRLPQPTGAKTRELVGAVSAAHLRDEQRVDNALSDPETAKAFAKYRADLTDAEAVNSKRLERLAWFWSECGHMAKRQPEAAAQCERLADKFAELAAHNWNLDGLRTERGWAERVCRDYELLPTSLRERSV